MRKIIIISFLLAFLFSCKKPLPENRNDGASLPSSFKFDELKVKAITTLVNTNKGTTSILFGNEQAIKELKREEVTNAEKKLVLVTWQQQEDPRWFGAKIPDHLLMVEVLQTNTIFENINEIQYQLYEGKELTLSTDKTNNTNRVLFIKSIKPSVIP